MFLSKRHLTFLIAIALAWLLALTPLAGPSVAAQAIESNHNLEERVQALVPDIEKYIESGMRGFDVPGLAIGIVVGDKLVYAKGFGVRGKSDQAPVDTRTLFQIGSTTKAFLAATMAIAVDRGQLRWDDRVSDLYPDFQLKDPWVTREFRVFDLMAQRSGLPPYVNDMMGVNYGYDEDALIRSLRYVEPRSSFRSTYSYTNVTHLLTGRIVAKAAGAANWFNVLQQEIFDPLGMKDSSYSAAAFNAAPNHAQGHRYTPEGSVQVPIMQLFPYEYAGAGAINSNIEDMSRWVRLQLGNGSFEGRRIVSPENLTFTHTPKVEITDKQSYAYGWGVGQTPNGAIVAHSGSSHAFGAFVGLQLDRKIGVIVLTNETNVSFPDAVGLWTLNQLLNNPTGDYAAAGLEKARANAAAERETFARPSSPRPAPPLESFAGSFSNPSFGEAALSVQGDSLILELKATGAQIKLDPWDGDIFTIGQVPNGKFADVVKNLGPLPSGFGQLQLDAQGKLNLIKLTFTDNGQVFEFQREQDSVGCVTQVCMRSPQYYALNLGRLPHGMVSIIGGGLNSQVSTSDTKRLSLLLQGGVARQQQLNRQFVATQLSLLAQAGGSQTALQSNLLCYRVNFQPVQLSNGAALTPSMTLGELFAQVRQAGQSGNVIDQRQLANLLERLNGNDPLGRCQ